MARDDISSLFQKIKKSKDIPLGEAENEIKLSDISQSS